MPLSPPQARAPEHTRQVTFQGFRRQDGLWDIEAEMKDTKSQVFDLQAEGVWQPGEAIHHLSIRLTVDAQLMIHGIEVAMDSTPHQACPSASRAMQNMVGCTLGAGWRKNIEKHLSGVRGCTHLRELLFNMATVAFQTIQSAFVSADPSQPPPHLGRCLAWDFEGPLVARQYPVFFRPSAKR